jgi:hypothetical protein
MKKYAFPLMASLLIAGCNQPSPSNTEAVASTTAPTDAKPCVPNSDFSYAPLPAGVAIEIPVQLRQDRINAKADGSLRRVVIFEYLSGDQRSTLDSLVGSMAKGGFKAGAERVRDNGRIEVKLRKEKEQVILSVMGDPGSKPSHPSAKGTFALNMPYVMDVTQPISKLNH